MVLFMDYEGAVLPHFPPPHMERWFTTGATRQHLKPHRWLRETGTARDALLKAGPFSSGNRREASVRKERRGAGVGGARERGDPLSDDSRELPFGGGGRRARES